MAQTRTAFKPVQPPVAEAPVQSAPVAMTAPAVSAPDHTAQLQMIQQMSALSQMNMEWSKK